MILSTTDAEAKLWAVSRLGSEEGSEVEGPQYWGRACFSPSLLLSHHRIQGKRERFPIFKIRRLRCRESAWYFQSTQLFQGDQNPPSLFQQHHAIEFTSIRWQMCLARFYDSEVGCAQILTYSGDFSKLKADIFDVIPQRWDLLREIVFLFSGK